MVFKNFAAITYSQSMSRMLEAKEDRHKTREVNRLLRGRSEPTVNGSKSMEKETVTTREYTRDWLEVVGNMRDA